MTPKSVTQPYLEQIYPIIGQDMYVQVCAWEEYLHHEKRYSPHTLRNYLRDLQTFFVFFQTHLGEKIGLEHLGRLSTSDLRSFFAHRKSAGCQTRTNAATLSSLKGFVRYLYKQDVILCNAIEEFSVGRYRAELPRALNFPDMQLFLQEAINLSPPETLKKHPWVRYRDLALIHTLYGCGLRISELLSLNLDQVQLESKVLCVRGKGNKERQVPLLPITQEHLRRWMTHHPLHQKPMCGQIKTKEQNQPAPIPFFIGIRGGRMNGTILQSALRILRQKHGLPESLSPHALRHSYATHLLAGGANLRSIQELLGHASLSTTQHYTQVDATHLKSLYLKTHPRK